MDFPLISIDVPWFFHDFPVVFPIEILDFQPSKRRGYEEMLREAAVLAQDLETP